MTDIKLFISVPSFREPKSGFNASFLSLTANLLSNGLKNHMLVGIAPELAAQASCLSHPFSREQPLMICQGGCNAYIY